MTKIIAILNQKGGSGKTTISTNLAYAFKNGGYKVLLVDSDPQGSARDWNEANGGDILPVVGLDRETLPKDIQAIQKEYDWIIIDGAPQIAKMSVAAVKAADLVLIPVQPSPYDIWACADLVDVIQTRHEVTPNKPMVSFVLSRVIKNTKLSREVNEALKSYDIPVLDSFTSQKVVYPTTAAEGKTVFQQSDRASIEEIESIKKEVEELFNVTA